METELAEGNGAAAEGQPNAGALVAVATPNVPVHEGTRNPQVTRPGRARFAIFMDRDTKAPCNWDHKNKQNDAWLLRLARNRGHVREPSAALLIEFEADPLARAAWRQSKWAALSDNAKKPNWRQVVEFWACRRPSACPWGSPGCRRRRRLIRDRGWHPIGRSQTDFGPISIHPTRSRGSCTVYILETSIARFCRLQSDCKVGAPSLACTSEHNGSI